MVTSLNPSDYLPKEVMDIILRKCSDADLNVAASVCKAWREIVNHNLNRNLISALKNRTFDTDISTSLIESVNKDKMAMFFKLMPIRTGAESNEDLYNWKSIESESLIQAFAILTNLKKFELRSNIIEYTQITETVLHALSEKHPDLEAVTIESCPGISASGLTKFLSSMPKLNSVQLNTNQISKEVLLALENLKDIKSIVLIGSTRGVQESDIEALRSHLPTVTIDTEELVIS